jgi:hypothetical protein
MAFNYLKLEYQALIVYISLISCYCDGLCIFCCQLGILPVDGTRVWHVDISTLFSNFIAINHLNYSTPEHSHPSQLLYITLTLNLISSFFLSLQRSSNNVPRFSLLISSFRNSRMLYFAISHRRCQPTYISTRILHNCINLCGPIPFFHFPPCFRRR